MKLASYRYPDLALSAAFPLAPMPKPEFARTYLPHHVPLPFGQHHHTIMSADAGLHAIAAPRGSAKTTVTCLIDVLHAICYKTEDFIIIISETKTLAIGRVMDIKSEIESNDVIRETFGVLRGTIWKQDEIITANGVRLTAKGRNGQIRGEKDGPNRPSLIILDDVESSESAVSPLQREKVRNWYQTDVRRAGRPDG